MSAPVERFRSYLYVLAKSGLDRKLQAKVDLSGVVQQTLFEAHQAWHEVKETTAEEQMAWIRRILQHNLIDEVRKWSAAARNIDLEQALDRSSVGIAKLVSAQKASPPEQVLRNEELMFMAEALFKLPEQQRLAIELYHLQGLPLAEVAQVLERSKSATASLLYRGLQRLRVVLKDDSA